MKSAFKDPKKLKKINCYIAGIVFVLGVIAIYLLVARTVPPSSEAPAKVGIKRPEVLEVYSGWTVKCFQNDSSRNTASRCFGENAFQNESGERITLHLKMISRAGRSIPRLKVIAPFGIFLPAGIILTLPAQEEFTVPVQFCEGEGCYINLDLADDVVQELSNSDTLRVSYLESSRKTVDVDLPLSGFFDALKHLKRAETE